jgi:hypothetical protein
MSPPFSSNIKIRTQASSGKCLLTIFWDYSNIIHQEYMVVNQLQDLCEDLQEAETTNLRRLSEGKEPLLLQHDHCQAPHYCWHFVATGSIGSNVQTSQRNSLHMCWSSENILRNSRVTGSKCWFIVGGTEQGEDHVEKRGIKKVTPCFVSFLYLVWQWRYKHGGITFWKPFIFMFCITFATNNYFLQMKLISICDKCSLLYIKGEAEPESYSYLQTSAPSFKLTKCPSHTPIGTVHESDTSIQGCW